VPDFYVFCNSYDLEKIIEVANFHHDMFKGGEKILQAATAFRTNFVFCCFEHSFEPQDDSF
jgi:hypothetical protein